MRAGRRRQSTLPGEIAAGPIDLATSYELCRRLHRRHGTTYYWSTQLLPKVVRHHVHALYAFARYADDIVDEPAPGQDSAAALETFGAAFFAGLERGRSDHPVFKAVVHTARAFGIEAEAFERFLRSMAMDLTVATYETWDDLLGYMEGSAAVVGEMMLPILDPPDLQTAREPARALGHAFQLTNFIRDIAEDLDRGRQYLPQEDLRRFGVDLSQRRCTPGFVDLMRFEIGRARSLYAIAEPGIELLPPTSAPSIRAAHRLYSGILDEIESQRYDVFAGRARVSTRRKLLTVAGLAAGAARRA